jgi:WD40 repeat protein
LHTLLIESEDPLISPVRQVLPANAKVISMAVSDDGSSYAVACRDGAVWYWGSGAAHRQRHLQSGKDPIYGLDITDDGQWIATVGKDCVLRVWNASDGDLKFAATGHAYLATRVCLAPDGKQAVTTGQDGKLILWDLSLAKAEIRAAEVTSIVEIMDDAGGARWIASDGDGNVHIYSSSTFDLPPLKTWRAHNTKIWDLAVAPDGQHLVTAGEDGLARVWHRETGACIANIVSEKSKAFYATAISPDGRWLVVAGADKCPQVHDLQAALKGQTPVDPPHELAKGFTLKCRSEIEKLIFLDSGHFLSGDRSGMVRCWNVKNSEPLWEIKHHDEVVNSPDRPKYGSEQKGVYALSVAQSGRYLACSGRGIDRGISIWDLGEALCASAPTLVHVLHGHERGVNFLAFRDDDQHLVSASWDETVVMWDWRERERLLLRPIPNLSATLVTGNKLAVGIGLVGTGLGELFTLSFQNIPDKRAHKA